MNCYEALGVMRSTPIAEIRASYDARSKTLDVRLFQGASAEVVDAVGRAREVIEEAWATLGDARRRARYDRDLARLADAEAADRLDHRWHTRRQRAERIWALEHDLGLPLSPVLGFEPPRPGWDFPVSDAPTRADAHVEGVPPRAATGTGLGADTTVPSRRWGVSPLYDPLAAMETVADWLAPHGRPVRTVTIPSLLGLHSSEVVLAVAALDLRIATVRMTRDPAPVDGTVVDQIPLPGSVVRRSTTLTVCVAHPPAPGTAIT